MGSDEHPEEFDARLPEGLTRFGIPTKIAVLPCDKTFGIYWHVAHGGKHFSFCICVIKGGSASTMRCGCMRLPTRNIGFLLLHLL
jgi:hypothetical protein